MNLLPLIYTKSEYVIMAKQDEFYEQFLDELEVDIDFDTKNNTLIAKSAESKFSPEFDLPTLTQLLNQKSNEFIHAVLTDTNPRFEISIEDTSEFADREEFTVEFKFETAIALVNVNLTRLYFNTSELALTKEHLTNLKSILKENSFIAHPNSTEQSELYTLKINSADQLNSMLHKIEEFATDHKNVTSFADISEKNVVSFKKFKR